VQELINEYGVVILADTTTHERCAQWLSVRFREANIPCKIITTIGRAGTDWQVFELSPYRRTLKLEADMYFSDPTVVMDWFKMLQNEDIWVCQDVVDYRGNIIKDRQFRRHLDVNNLPNLYNAVTYFRRCRQANKFFNKLKQVYDNWHELELREWNQAEPDQDTAYAVTTALLDIKFKPLPIHFCHMKGQLNGCQRNDWTKELVWEWDAGLRINTYQQRYPTHYYVKEFLDYE